MWEGIRFTQCEGEEEEFVENDESGENSTLVAQEANLSSQSEPTLENEGFAPSELGGENWSACWLDDIQQIMTVELLLGQQEYFAPKSETDDSPPTIVVDSGAAISVTGLPWLKAWFKCLGIIISKAKMETMLSHSDKKFKFGNQMTFDSLGAITLCGQRHQVPLDDDSRMAKDRTLMIHADVVDLDIPLLLALPSLAKLNCSIDFGRDQLTFSDNSFTKLHVTDRNHLTFACAPCANPEKGADVVCVFKM